MPSEFNMIRLRLQNSLIHTTYFDVFNQVINELKQNEEFLKFLEPKYRQLLRMNLLFFAKN